ncbi:hypothetical protein FB451DRAFT_1305091 [Mycena latifolia]|nr:hypothetical protein FB451DRAFT_1305091 [Mycena latifolia]
MLVLLPFPLFALFALPLTLLVLPRVCVLSDESRLWSSLRLARLGMGDSSPRLCVCRCRALLLVRCSCASFCISWFFLLRSVVVDVVSGGNW